MHKIKLELQSGNHNSGKNWWFSVLCDLEIWWMTLKKPRAPLLYYFKLCASFHSHWSIPTGVTVRRHQVRVKIAHYLSYVSLKFDGWPWKTIGHLSYATSSFVYQFIAIGQFKLELRQIRVKIGHFLSHVTLGHPNRRQAIIWTNADPVHWRIYAALGRDELNTNALFYQGS